MKKPSKRKASRKPREWWIVYCNKYGTIGAYENEPEAIGMGLEFETKYNGAECSLIKVFKMPKRRGGR